MNQVEAYLHIQQMMMDNLQLDIQVPDELMSASVVHLSLQPLVENAIKHGFAGQVSNCRIGITAGRTNKGLVLRIEDNGQGCDPVRMNRLLRDHPGIASGGKAGGVRSGYGTLNVHRRIQLHCGEAYGLRYVATDTGTCVEIEMPFRIAERIPGQEELANV